MSVGGCRTEGVGISLDRTGASRSWKWGGGRGVAFGFPSFTTKLTLALVTHRKRPFDGFETTVMHAECDTSISSRSGAVGWGASAADGYLNLDSLMSGQVVKSPRN